MSNHFYRSIAAISLVIILLLGAFLWLKHRIDGTLPAGQSHRVAPVAHQSLLKPQDKEAILVDTVHHTITTQTKDSSKTEYVRNPVIHIGKDGSVNVDRKLYGLEFNPFFGVGYGNGLRLHIGASWLYAWRFDVNSHLAFAVSKNAERTVLPLTSVSYNFWRSTSVFMGTNPLDIILQQKPTYQGGFLFRF